MLISGLGLKYPGFYRGGRFVGVFTLPTFMVIFAYSYLITSLAAEKPILAITKKTSTSARILCGYPSLLVEHGQTERLITIFNKIGEKDFSDFFIQKTEDKPDLSCSCIAQQFINTLKTL
jgi:hypothetical protein